MTPTSPRRRGGANRSLPAETANRLILGDNLLVMLALPDESIDLIYIDPPFFTGRKQRSNGGAAHTFDDAWAGGLDAYLTWLRERVVEMRRLLRPTGVLYVHCDFHAGHYIKALLDEVFGGERFQNEIIWHYGLGAANATRHFLRKHDTIFVYRKSDAVPFAAPVERRSMGQHIARLVRQGRVREVAAIAGMSQTESSGLPPLR